MNTEIGSTLVNGYSLNTALSVIYTDLKDTIEVNSISSKYVFADISQLTPEFNILKKYPIGAFKTFTNTIDANIRNIAIIPAIPYDIKRAGIVTLVDVSTMSLKALGLVKNADISSVEILWLEYISKANQVVSTDAGNLITLGTDGKIYLSEEAIEQTEDKVYCIDDDIKIVGVYRTYLDYNPEDIKNLENIHDGAFVVIIRDPLHDNKTWLYELSHVKSASPTITPVKEYTKVKEYPSVVAVKQYVDAKVMHITRNFDKDTIVKNPTNELWQVAFDRHTINKNKNGLYAVDYDVLRKELLQVPSTPGNIVIFDQNGYIKDDGWGITSEDEAIDDGARKLVSKKFLNAQRITDSETSALITSADIKK